MSSEDTFDDWFKKLTPTDQQALLKHIKDKYFSTLNEGYYGGPSTTRGYYSGPSAGNAVCPTCKRPY